VNNGIRIQAVERAILVLKCFSQNKSELKLTEICEMLDLNKSTAHGIINTLKYYGMIDQDEETKKYRLGLSLLALGSTVQNRLDVRTVAEPILKDICSKTDETVHLGILEGMEVVYIDKYESSQSIRLFTTIGTRYPAYCTGIGKAMLAFMPEEELLKHIPDEMQRFTEYTIREKKQLLQHLKITQQRGYSVDDEENVEGLRCVGVPIFNYSKKVIAAISASGPSMRMTKEKLPEVAEILREGASEISKRLGYRN